MRKLQKIDRGGKMYQLSVATIILYNKPPPKLSVCIENCKNLKKKFYMVGKKQQEMRLTKTKTVHVKGCYWLKIDGRPEIFLTKFRSQNLPGKLERSRNNSHKRNPMLVEEKLAIFWCGHTTDHWINFAVKHTLKWDHSYYRNVSIDCHLFW